MLKYDSMLGTFKAEVKIVDNETISVDGKHIKVVANRDPLKLPWAELGIDIVIEVLISSYTVPFHLHFYNQNRKKRNNQNCPYMQGTGVFVDGPGAGKHIQAGAKKVIITAPAKGADIPTYVVGVNEQDYTHEIANIIRSVDHFTNRASSRMIFVRIL